MSGMANLDISSGQARANLAMEEFVAAIEAERQKIAESSGIELNFAGVIEAEGEMPDKSRLVSHRLVIAPVPNPARGLGLLHYGISVLNAQTTLQISGMAAQQRRIYQPR